MAKQPVKLQLRTTLLKHQGDALAKCAYRVAFAYLMETGTGKTCVVIGEWQEFVAASFANLPSQLHIRDLLVVAPAGSYRNWYAAKDEQPSELEKHLDPKLYKAMNVAGWGNKPAERKAVDALIADTSRPRALFVNVEALSVATSPAFEACKKFLRGGHVLMVLDESTVIRSNKAERTKRVIELGKLAKARRIMTGLVTPKSPMDLYWQFYFLDPAILGFENFVPFRARYAEVTYQCYMPNELIRHRLFKYVGIKPNGMQFLPEHKFQHRLRQYFDVAPTYKFKQPVHALRTMMASGIADMGREDMVALAERIGCYVNQVPLIERYRNLPELQQKIAPYSFQVLKKDCLNLKPKTYVPRDVQLTKEQERIYTEIRENAMAQLESLDYVTAETAIAQILRLHQVVCGHVRDEEKKLHDVPSNRIDAIMEILDDYEGKAIIWTTYVHELLKITKKLEEVYGQGSVSTFYGGNIQTRGTGEIRFLHEPKCRFIVSTQAAGGRGNTWNAAALTIYAANSYDLEMRFQSEDRNHRVGQANAVTYIDLIARGTVEEKILHCLRHKLNLATIITNENYREWII